jgi:predicted ferric reductase
MKGKRVYLFVIILILGLVYAYFIVNKKVFDTNLIVDYLVLGLIVITGLYAINIISGQERKKSSKFKDKLFNSLVNDSNTIYIMMDSNTKKVLYMSDNIEDVIGVKSKGRKNDDIVSDILEFQ